jgi:hypothetical protein
MFDLQWDASEVKLESSYICGHCIVEMVTRGNNMMECPICSSRYQLNQEKND